jgi:hypothetical protein
MNRTLSESTIVKAVAEQSARRIARRAIAALQRMEQTMSGDDSGLSTTWDEICVQVQYEESYYWDAYDETVKAIVAGYVSDLPVHEREAIWLQTEPGFDWDCDESETPVAYPVIDDEITEYITSEYVYAEAGRWSNARIRAYIDRSSLRD